ncbi:MAG: TatD family hydrolase [Burkholderiales bacterium]|nr:TatD family hydrolase [Burkholderiales bacterium]
MRMIDPHLHLDRMKGKEVETLSMAGVEGAVLPTPHMLQWMVSAETLFRMWRMFLDFEVKHSASLGIKVFVTLSVPFYGLDTESVAEALKAMPGYLDHPSVVGLGEIGMDAGIPDEERLFRAQLAIAREQGKPVIVHTPTPLEPQAVEVCRQIIKVLESERFPMDKVVFDHTGRASFRDRIDTGAMVGLSLCYDKLRPEDAAEIVAEYPQFRSQLLINSEFGYAADGYFSVPRSVLSMRRLGLKRDAIETITWDNPKRFFDLDID